MKRDYYQYHFLVIKDLNLKNNFLIETLKEFGLKESTLFDNTLVNLLLEKPSDSNIYISNINLEK